MNQDEHKGQSDRDGEVAVEGTSTTRVEGRDDGGDGVLIVRAFRKGKLRWSIQGCVDVSAGPAGGRHTYTSAGWERWDKTEEGQSACWMGQSSKLFARVVVRFLKRE